MSRLLDPGPVVVAPGAVHVPGWLDDEAQRSLARACARWVTEAGGAHRPVVRNGGVMTVGIACLGWHWSPYRYTRTRVDGDGSPVPPLPAGLAALARRAVAETLGPGAAATFDPDVALVNEYGPASRMGMHVDREELADAPVVSLSLGDTARFRFGNTSGRSRPWVDVELCSGDLFVFGGPSRRAYHGVPKVLVGTAPAGLELGASRVNVTVRQTGFAG
ncbi:MAG: alpha-ketoglutarate-dependent dioxygenase AlkB [Actinomycetota bacterium]|nr:alpha-ketoglutarate-dependent dioxygenase AlkB [Actinomycetota bacterium]